MVPPAIKNLGASVGTLSSLRVDLDVSLSVQAAGGTVGVDVAAQYLQLAGAVATVVDELHAFPAASRRSCPRRSSSPPVSPTRFRAGYSTSAPSS